MGKRLFSDDFVRSWIREQNPWWDKRPYPFAELPKQRRLFVNLFTNGIIDDQTVKPWVLLGGRKVGKTTLLKYLVQDLLATQTAGATQLFYLNLNNPVVSGIPIAELIGLALDEAHKGKQERVYFMLDQAEYLSDWPNQLRQLPLEYPAIKLVLGSVVDAARIQQDSQPVEYQTFLLPPPTFHEFVYLRGAEKESFRKLEELGENYIAEPEVLFKKVRLPKLNQLFIQYLNFGGLLELYPSLTTIGPDQTTPLRDMLAVHLLASDLPAIYGIADTRTLNHFFASLAYISGNETSVEELANNFSMAKNTIRKYLVWLEACHLIKLVERVDMDGKRFDRANFFKIYLVNPTLRSALFHDVAEDDLFAGSVVETAVFAQLLHRTQNLPYYSSWSRGSVDLVRLGANKKPNFALEIKWSNQFVEKPTLLKNLRAFCKRNELSEAYITTLDIRKDRRRNDMVYKFVPAAFFAYLLGRNMVYTKMQFTDTVKMPKSST